MKRLGQQQLNNDHSKITENIGHLSENGKVTEKHKLRKISLQENKKSNVQSTTSEKDCCTPSRKTVCQSDRSRNVSSKSKIPRDINKSHHLKKLDKIKNTKDGCEKTERRLKENPRSQPLDETTAIDRKQKTSKHKKITAPSSKNSEKVKQSHRQNRDSTTWSSKLKQKSNNENVRKVKKDVCAQKRVIDDKSHCVAGAISSRKASGEKYCAYSLVKDTEKITNISAENDQDKIRYPSKQKELSTSEFGNRPRNEIARGKNNKRSKEKKYGKKSKEKIENLVANEEKCAKKQNSSKQTDQSGQDLNKASGSSATEISPCFEKKWHKRSKQKHEELSTNQNQDKLSSEKNGKSSKQSNHNINLPNPAVSATLQEKPKCVQTTCSENKTKKKFKRSGSKGDKRGKLKDPKQRMNEGKLLGEASKIKKSRGNEQEKRDIGNVSKQTAGVKNSEDKYHHQKSKS